MNDSHVHFTTPAEINSKAKRAAYQRRTLRFCGLHTRKNTLLLRAAGKSFYVFQMMKRKKNVFFMQKTFFLKKRKNGLGFLARKKTKPKKRFFTKTKRFLKTQKNEKQKTKRYFSDERKKTFLKRFSNVYIYEPLGAI